MKINPAGLHQVEVLKEAPLEDLNLLVEKSILRSVEEDSFFLHGQQNIVRVGRRGLIETGRERIVMRNPHGLVEIAEGIDQS